MLTELEYKYDASKITLNNFKAIIDKFIHKVICSNDTYFAHGFHPDRFHRLRVEKDSIELTYKQKTVPENNWIRVEVNLPLHPNTPEECVENYLKYQNYSKSFEIDKTGIEITSNFVNFSYYSVYFETERVPQKFIEVEVIPGVVEQFGVEEALRHLQAGEKVLGKLGLKEKDRLSESLFERYRTLR